MQTKGEIIVIIVAVTGILLFLGILFIVTLLYSSNKRRKLENEKKQMKDQFENQLLQSTIEIQEQTLNFISQEIHDNVGQLLSFAKMQINIMQQSKATDISLLEELKESIGKAMTELRDLAKGLNADNILSFDLERNIVDEIDRLNKTQFTKASVDISCDCKKINDEKKLILFRLIQESLQNIIKHAKATRVEISISVLDNFLSVIIKDDGIGFNVEEKLQSKKGLGLKNIFRRTRLLNGTALINSKPNEGTFILIKLPYV